MGEDVRLPVQFTEPLPSWLELEIEAGRAKIPELRAAIVRAIQKSRGMLPKNENNQDQGYKFTGYDSVIDAVRTAMADEGVSVDQVTTDVEEVLQVATRQGFSTLWKWRVVCLITHVSGACVVRIIRPITLATNKASAIARTAADRTLLLTLMRLAGRKEEQPETEPEAEGRSYRAKPGQPPHDAKKQEKPPERVWKPEELAAAKHKVDGIIAEIKVAAARSRLVTWGRILRALALPDAERARARAAWDERCAALEIAPKELVRDVNRLGPLPEARIARDAQTGDIHDRETGELL